MFTERNYKDYDRYTIETNKNGRFMHILGYCYKCSDRVSEDLFDARGNPLRIPYTVSEYNWVIISLDELLGCENADEMWDLITDYECAAEAWENDYTWEQLVRLGMADPTTHSKYLPYWMITYDTPDGDYFYYLR